MPREIRVTLARWTPSLMSEVVREYGLPDDAAVAVVLQVLVRRDRTSDQRRGLVLNPAVDAFLVRHASILARVVTALDTAGKRSYLDLAARNPEAHAGLVAVLAHRASMPKALQPMPPSRMPGRATVNPFMSCRPWS
ncbi:hypothetical protein ACQEVI_20010 [Promicromonospora sp. CA-289599]|uniref:hypothetical protein n=1 Tax=Promicromonospora sp. CA-289599 TaxID=3240014 RepID=UPI003D89D0E7